jgi:cytosine deaminase
MQIVVFPQEGIFKQRDVKDLMHAALDMGADVVGGIPYNDPDPEEHLDFVFDLAQHYGKPR